MDVCNKLGELDIPYERADHVAVYTCEQADEIELKLVGIHTKNLFLRNRKGNRHFLVTIPAENSVDLKALSKALEVPQQLSFASPERLMKHLGVEPGSVSLLAVVKDLEQSVEVIIDESVWRAGAVLCHPLVNTSTLSVSIAGLEKLYAHTGHQPRVVAVPQRS